MPRNIPVVIPIVTPQIDWINYVSNVYKIIKRSPSRRLDETNRSVGDYFSFIASLGEFSEQIDISQAVRYRDSFLEHLSFTFLFNVSPEEYLEILRESQLHCTDNSDIDGDSSLLVIASGTVAEWKRACFTFCSNDYSFRVRFIFDAVTFYMERFKVFNGLSKQFLKDQTFILEKPQ